MSVLTGQRVESQKPWCAVWERQVSTLIWKVSLRDFLNRAGNEYGKKKSL
jgi:hypothetical protein